MKDSADKIGSCCPFLIIEDWFISRSSVPKVMYSVDKEIRKNRKPHKIAIIKKSCFLGLLIF